MLEISKMIKSLTDTESELKRIIQAVQVHERGIHVDYKINIIGKDIIEFYITFESQFKTDKFIIGLSTLINESLTLCEVSEDSGKITMVFFKYLF